MNWITERIAGFVLRNYKNELFAWLQNRGLHVPRRTKEQWAQKYHVSVEFIEELENLLVGKLIERLNKILG